MTSNAIEPAPPAPPAATFEPAVGADGIADFTVTRTPIRFRVDGDVFDAAPALPALELFALRDTPKRLQAAAEGEQSRVILDVFGKILLPGSLERFTGRLSSRTDPIDAAQFAGILRWLLARYAGRPTTQPSGSSTGSGSPGGGTSSTGSSPSAASTSNGSARTGS